MKDYYKDTDKLNAKFKELDNHSNSIENNSAEFDPNYYT
eukprot:CAMPEP_0116903038 /NCGR_PEP_ID=MMETSP0467-20121206/10474_1 /TAXON_ID=283647 /ORGANISM="Mesodinium pulex, Strain SPMC105" /LENGTH=38 /DNA_ID= /DNA_START= /DNA_END= /DNA_ORIENTATION=